MLVVEVARPGGPDHLVPTERPDPEPGPGEVLIGVEAAGVNYIDVYRRTGLYPVTFPDVAGCEIAGRVLAVGPGVGPDGPQVEDRVASCDVAGGYAQLVTVSAARVVPVPDGVSSEAAAAVLLQGLTAHYLSHSTFPLAPGHRCLVHAAAGGVGTLLVQLARLRGAQVVATVGSAAKAELPRRLGAEHVIVTGERDFAAAVVETYGAHSIDVVYDGIGQATFTAGLSVLKPRGLMVSYGNASGAVEPIAPLTLSTAGSLFLTRPNLVHYTATTDELRERAADLFGHLAAGRLEVVIGERLPLTEAARAHELLQARATTGKLLLIP